MQPSPTVQITLVVIMVVLLLVVFVPPLWRLYRQRTAPTSLEGAW